MNSKFTIKAGLLLFAALFLAGCDKKTGAPVYEFTAVTRGNIEKTVSSTGTIEPVATVKVLPRMSGKVEKIYVDYNDVIHEGDILAELNTDMLRLKREQQLASVIKAQANYELQRMNYDNQVKLAEKNLISEYDLKNSKTTLAIQNAELTAAQANLKEIETEINQWAFITSPIDGIVLERNINVGDTVVDSSSSNSSKIFTLAENLQEMKIESWVGELDIVSIKEGQDVRFTLESLPGRTYTGVVASKRLMPSVQDSVVSYNVIINIDNKDGSLLPGMTCTVEFIEERNENALLVPNAALRYSPTSLSTEEISDLVFNAGLEGLSGAEREEAVKTREAARQAAAGAGAANKSGAQQGLAGMLMPGGGRMRPPGGGPGGGGAQAGGSGARNGGGSTRPTPPKPLWYEDEAGRPACILVRTGMSDGSNTEIRPLRPGGKSLEGMSIILREKAAP